jgi:hypothetical protein
MNTYTERRDTSRILVGPEFAVSFTLKGHGFRDIRIMNLSVGGCFALVGTRNAHFFMRGAALEDLAIHHPDLPRDPIIATVAYVLGGRPGGESLDMMGVGLNFLCMEASTRRALETWVEAARAAGQAAD